MNWMRVKLRQRMVQNQETTQAGWYYATPTSSFGAPSASALMISAQNVFGSSPSTYFASVSPSDLFVSYTLIVCQAHGNSDAHDCAFATHTTIVLVVALTGLLQFADRGTAAQVLCGCCVAVSSLAMQLQLAPYREPEANLLKALVDGQIFLTFLISFILRVLAADEGEFSLDVKVILTTPHMYIFHQ